MKWLRRELRDRIKHEHKLRKDLREALTGNEGDRHLLLTELAKREDVLDELSHVKQGMGNRFIFIKWFIVFFTCSILLFHIIYIIKVTGNGMTSYCVYKVRKITLGVLHIIKKTIPDCFIIPFYYQRSNVN